MNEDEGEIWGRKSEESKQKRFKNTINIIITAYNRKKHTQIKWKEIFWTPSTKKRSSRTSSRDLSKHPTHTSWTSSVLTVLTSRWSSPTLNLPLSARSNQRHNSNLLSTIFFVIIGGKFHSKWGREIS